MKGSGVDGAEVLLSGALWCEAVVLSLLGVAQYVSRYLAQPRHVKTLPNL